MDIAVKRGFAIGFVVVAGLATAYGCQPELQRAVQALRGDPPTTRLVIPVEPPPKPSAPSTPPPSAGPPPQASTPTPAAPSAPRAALTPPPASEPPAPATPRAPDAPATVTPPAAEIPAASAADAAKGGAFDIVRVEPSGEMVVAGRCAANCDAELLANGKPHDTAKADAQGQWAMTPAPLPPGDYQLALRTKGPDGKEETSQQTLTVAIPKPPSKDVVVVLNAPDAPSTILQRPESKLATAPLGQPAAAAPVEERAVARKAGAALAISAVEAENGRFYAQGSGPTDAKLRLYLNNAPLTSATIGADERWSLRVERGLAPGSYVVRADQLDTASNKVVARVETNFTYAPQVAAIESPPPAVAPTPSSPPRSAETAAAPSTPTPRPQTDAVSRASPETPAPVAPRPDAPPAAASDTAAPPVAETSSRPEAPPAPSEAAVPAPSASVGSAPQAADPANPVVASIDTAQVRRGDSLWRISRSTYGRGMRYTVIYEANDGQIRNPNLIYPGQVLVLPADAAAAAMEPGRP